MAIKSGDKYLCSYCNREYDDPFKADECRNKHDLLYVQISREDLSRLIQFLYTKNEKLLTPTLVESLEKHRRRIAFGKE